MTIIIEGRLVIALGPSWDVVKYDDHPVYNEGIKCLQGTKAVDILGERGGDLYFIEIKDFRGHRIENRDRLKDGDLAVEVALKVRDTLAGLVGAIRTRGSDQWRTWAELILHKKPKVILWLERDQSDPGMSIKDTLDRNLRWLCPHVTVVDRRRLPPLDITVRNLSDRVFALRSLVNKKKQGERLSLDEYKGAMAVTEKLAREQTEKLCQQGVLKRIADDERFVPGPRWAEFHEDPG